MNKVHYKHCNTATRPAGTGTLENVASEDQAKSTNLFKHSLTFATWNVRNLLHRNPPYFYQTPSSIIKSTSPACKKLVCTVKAYLWHKTPKQKLLQDPIQRNRKLHRKIRSWNRHRFVRRVLTYGVESIQRKTMLRAIRCAPTPLSIVSAYSPTEDGEDTEKDAFYSVLIEYLKAIPRKDVPLIGRDLNAKQRKQLPDEEKNIGKFAIGERNNNGQRLAELIVSLDLVAMNTTFQKKRRKLATWISNDRKTRNEIDYILTNR